MAQFAAFALVVVLPVAVAVSLVSLIRAIHRPYHAAETQRKALEKARRG